VLFRVIRRLVGLAVAFALVSLVTQHVGTALAARSMSGFVTGWSAAQHGNTSYAASLSTDLGRQWRDLGTHASGALHSVQDAVAHLAPPR